MQHFRSPFCLMLAAGLWEEQHDHEELGACVCKSCCEVSVNDRFGVV